MTIGIETYPKFLFRTGIGVAIKELVAALQGEFPQHTFVELEPAYRPWKGRNKFNKVLNHLLQIWWTNVTLPRMARQRHCQVVLCTSYFTPFHCSVPTITILHDMSVWEHAEWYPRWWRWWLNRFGGRAAARHSVLITAPTDDAASAVARYLRVKKKRIRRVYWGAELPNVPATEDQAVLRTYGIPPGAEYVLHLGAASGYKNLPRLVEAFASVRARLSRDLRLVLAGPATNVHGSHDYDRIRAKMDRCGVVSAVHILGHVPRLHCAVLLRNAAVYGFPSLAEGFGLPLIEAMASGTPVAASSTPCLLEIGGDAALFFDPLDANEMANALTRLLEDSELRNQLIERGRNRAAEFTWQRTAREYMKLFEEVATNSAS